MRMFLVGNGVSLKKTNLDLLVGLPSMGVNRIHKIYPETKWRPTHFVKVDYSPFDNETWQSEVYPHIERREQCLLWHAFHGGITAVNDQFEITGGLGDVWNVTYIPRCKHTDLGTGEWHDYCTGLNSIVTMANWAVLLGFDEIVLVGCDGKYADHRRDHFTPNYYAKVDSDYIRRNNDMVTKAHDLLAAKCPVPILDATVGGSLTQHRKVVLEEIINGSR